MNITREKKFILYGLAFIIPIIILLINYNLVHIFPFGDKTILYRDLKGQYVSYFSALRNAVLHHGGLLYSFHKGLGGNMIGLIAYYLMSPFNILIILFPGKYLVDAILLITILKIGTCGITFLYFLKYRFKRFNYSLLIFTTAYSLMAFNIVYQSNIMWLDAVYLLPLVMTGIYKIIEDGKKKLYVITLALTIITSFYTGFMVCIFSIIYYLYLVLLKMYEEKLNVKFFIKKSWTFILCSIISGLLSLFIIVPTLFNLQGGKSQFAFFTTPLAKDFKFTDLFSKIYINNIHDKNILWGLPDIYVGILILFFVILFFINRNIKLHKKIAAFIVFAIFIISFYVNKLNYIWHGFNQPQGYNYRYSFIFGFFMVYIGYLGFNQLKEIKKYKIILATILLLLPLIYFYKHPIEILTNKDMVVSAFFVLIYGILIYLYTLRKKENIILCIMSTIFFIELLINGYCTFSNLPYANKDVVNYYQRNVEDVTNYIQKNDTSFYRLGKTFSFNINDPMLLNYKGMSEFSSMYKASLRNLINSFGFINNGYWMYYGTGATLTSNSLLNIKYIVEENKNGMPGYKYLYEKDGLYVYENEFYLPVGFMVNDNLLNVKVSPLDNPYVLQEKVLSSMINSNNYEQCYFKLNNYSLTTQNLKKISSDRRGNIYQAINPNKNTYINISFIAPNDYPIYYYSAQSASVTVNGKSVGGYSEYDYKTFNIGKFKQGERVNIQIAPETNKAYFSSNSLNYLNLDNYNYDYNILKENTLNVTHYTNSSLNGTITVTKPNELLYTSIPYDKGWRLYVNGKKYNYENVLGALMGIKLPKGTYNIKLYFIPEGLILGTVISTLTGALCILYIVIRKKRKKNN